MQRALAVLVLGLAGGLAAQQPSAAPTQLTIYNQDFAVARTTVPLDLHAGVNEVLTTNVTSQLEPDSVVLRDPGGRTAFRVVEQNYDAGVVNQLWLLEKYEGKTIDFQTAGMQVIETTTGEHKTLPATLVQGKIVRAGSQPLIEVNGHLQFQLPGLPVFPATTEGLLLKPTLRWQIETERPLKLAAEMDYITHGLKWHATYNLVMPEEKEAPGPERSELLGWVTMENKSGTDFPQATVQLMAGDVAKLQEMRGSDASSAPIPYAVSALRMAEVTQKAFDDFHLYDLHRTVSLRNGETKQEQFLEAEGVVVERSYRFESNEGFFGTGRGFHDVQKDSSLGSNTQVAIRQVVKNTAANHLGLPLPAGRLRLYRRDTGGQMQFVGEGMISHTAAEQPVELTSGNAFDLTAARRQTDFHVDNAGHTMDESFEVKLANQKAQPVTIHVVEHLNRSRNWEITAKSSGFEKRDSATADFAVMVPAKGETVLTYTVHYSW